MIEDLKEYKNIVNEIKHIKEEIKTLNYIATSPRRSIITGMPKGSPAENDKMASMMIRFEELEEKYKGLLTDLIDKQTFIESLIESLDPLERDLIRYRYIDCLPWYKIEEKLHYSQRTVFRLHAKILKKLDKMAHSDTVL